MITLRFVTRHDAISAGIRVAEYGFWASHVEALMPDGTLLGAHADGGVMARPRDYDKGAWTRELFVDLHADPVTEMRFNRFLEAQLGKPYDLEAIAAIALQRDWREADAWFCSELAAAALEDCGWFETPLATEVNHITPRDLLLIVSGRPDIDLGKSWTPEERAAAAGRP